MVLHLLSLRNRRGQMNIGFILSIILFASLLIVVVINIISLLPLFKDKIDEDILKSRAVSLSILLFDKPGVPYDWAANPTVVGFAYYNNYTNETEMGVLSAAKVNYVNASLNYSQVKNSLNVDPEVDFRIIIRNATDPIMDFYNVTAGRTDRVIALRRFAVINTTAVNITLLVW